MLCQNIFRLETHRSVHGCKRVSFIIGRGILPFAAATVSTRHRSRPCGEPATTIVIAYMTQYIIELNLRQFNKWGSMLS